MEIGSLVVIVAGVFKDKVGRLQPSQHSPSGYMVSFYNGTIYFVNSLESVTEATQEQIREFMVSRLLVDGFSQAEIEHIMRE